MPLNPQPGILDIELYVGGASTLQGRRDVVKLSSNENPYGPPPAAIAAMKDAARLMHLYPSSDHAALRAALGRVNGIDPDRIICGAGSDEIISFLAYAYAGPGTEVVHTRHGFALYRIAALAAGATPVEVPEANRHVDIDAVLAAITPRTRLVFITNPGNPTTNRIAEADLVRLADGMPDHAILVLDGAYAEFADGYDGGAALAVERVNVLMMRTFSKLYGLGGLRVGWAYADRGIIDVLNRIRGPFNLGAPQLAAAEAALGDTAHTEKTLRENARLRTWLRDQLLSLGIACDESHANFVLARFASAEAAQAADAALKADGIIVRYVASYKLPEALRITVGDEAACRRVIAALRAMTGVAA
ncbi:histidinol-phosphate transaminase [Ovoidimarina sediminis]|uniref:histidinol-phosphate transaminase n=1 Tax=Ovoidimarina sediminis TaxID=3079856 RepID=UPI00290B0331|nr:histidinol-phosphate transaminase [Rhodophyticola sp. MJ-SS7]MDU8942907.1 histidinol-phosphate transaminase [Rhodophyticola sp. MJ-SS7]